MKVEMCFEQLETLLDSLEAQTSPTEKLQTYAAIMVLLTELDHKVANEGGCPLSLYKEYRNKLVWHCQAIAGLDDDNGHDSRQHGSWARTEISKLKSPMCFKI